MNGSTKKCHYSVPDVFVDDSSVSCDAFFKPCKIFVQERDNFFRRKIFGKRRESTDVAEHDGDIDGLSSKSYVSLQKIIADLGCDNLSESVPHELLFLERLGHRVECVAEQSHLVVGADYGLRLQIALGNFLRAVGEFFERLLKIG